MLWIGQPAGETEAVLWEGIVPRKDAHGGAGLAKLGEVGLIVFTAGQHVAFRGEVRVLHREEGREGFLMRGEGSLGFLQARPSLCIYWIGPKAGMLGFN